MRFIFSLSGCALKEDDAKLLGVALRKQRNKELGILRLDISSNFILDLGVKYIAKGLKNHDNLWFLDLSKNFIKSIKPFTKILNTTKLNSLLLNENYINDEEIIALCDVLLVNKTLFTLELGGNKMTDAGAKYIAELLKTNTTITRLNLMQNDMTETGAAALIEGMRLNRTLIDLQFFGYTKTAKSFSKHCDISNSDNFNDIYATLNNTGENRNKSVTLDDKMDYILEDNKDQRKKILYKAIYKDYSYNLNHAKLLVFGDNLSGKSTLCTSLFDKTYLSSLNFGLDERFAEVALGRTAALSATGEPWTTEQSNLLVLFKVFYSYRRIQKCMY